MPGTTSTCTPTATSVIQGNDSYFTSPISSEIEFAEALKNMEMNVEATGFKCADPDFRIRCLPEGVEFDVKRAKLSEGSEVFKDMFSCCDDTDAEAAENTKDNPTSPMEVFESPSTFAAFLKLLHNPPSRYVEEDISEQIKYETKVIMKPPRNAIPLPLIAPLLALADKYIISPYIFDVLHSHLWAHRSENALKVYGLATKYSPQLDWIAADASMFLIHPLMHTYTLEQISVIPTAVAYHKLVALQHHRATRLRELLRDEDLFPHRYGECLKHGASANAIWMRKKEALFWKVDSGTDVAAEMTVTLEELGGCESCGRRWIAATEMLAYKCRRVPRRTDKLFPSEPK